MFFRRSHALLLVVVGFVALTNGRACAQVAAPGEIKTHRDIVFAQPGGVELLLDLEVPVADENPPLVVFIHGGGWTGGNRKSARLKWLHAHGYAIARIEYRMSHEAIFPAQIHDCKGALRWLRAHQEEYGYDAERVVVVGSSAGGHLVALMGTSGDVESLEGTTANHLDQSSTVQGVIDYFGASDFVLRSKDQPAATENPQGSVYKLLGGPVSENLELARLASSATHVDPSDPPLLMIHGENDPVVHLSQSERLLAAYQEHKLDAKLHVEADKGHGWNPPTEEEQTLIVTFLEKHLRGK